MNYLILKFQSFHIFINIENLYFDLEVFTRQKHKLQRETSTLTLTHSLNYHFMIILKKLNIKLAIGVALSQYITLKEGSLRLEYFFF